MWLRRLLVVPIVVAICSPVEAQQIAKITEDMLRQLREREAQIKIKSFCWTETEYCFPQGNGIWHFERLEDHFPDRFNTKYWKPRLVVDDDQALFKLLRQTYAKIQQALRAGDIEEGLTYFADLAMWREYLYHGSIMTTYQNKMPVNTTVPAQHFIDFLSEDLDNSVGPWLHERASFGRVEFRTKRGNGLFFNLQGDNVWRRF